MLLLLMLPVVFVVARVYVYLQLCAPSNVLIARVRAAPPRPRTAAALLLLAATLLVVMHLLADSVESGAPGWLNLVVLVLAWDSIKFGLAGVLVILRWLRQILAAAAEALIASILRVWAATRNCPETATKLPGGGHENCPLTVTGSARHDVVCLTGSHG